MIFSAPQILPMDGPPIPWGALRVSGGRITEIGTRDTLRPGPGEEVREFPDGVIMPGFVNAHCHLELGMARGMLPRGEAFPLWVSRLRKATEGAGPVQWREAIRLGALECLKNGITTVADVGNSGEAAAVLADMPIRSFPYLELTGLDPKVAADRLKQGTEWLASQPESHARYRPGVTCHAPYSCSEDLLRFVAGADGLREGPFTLHVAESAEEMAMFREGRGALVDFCRRVFPGLKLEPGPASTPVRLLHRAGALPPGTLVVHGNAVDAEEAALLAGAGASVALCPRSRAFFGHAKPPLALYREAGINLCLGTDSMASNEGLSMFDEMAELQREFPDIPARDILAMATRNGARALGLGKDLGMLRPGARADLIAIALRHHPECDLHEEIVGEAHEVVAVVVDGEEVVR